MNQKVVALFLAFIMVMSIFPFLLSGGNRQNTTETTNAQSFSNIGGKQVNVPLNSLSDGLAITPSDVIAAQYIDIVDAEKSHLQLIVGNTSTLDTLYGAKVETIYSARLGNGGFDLHKISPEIINFPYYLSPEPYKGYQLLLRSNGIYNVVGNPMIMGTENSTKGVINVISGDAKPSDAFDEILKYSVDNAQLETAAFSETGANQIYIAWKAESSDNYSRTTVYLNPTQATIGNITEYAAEGRSKGLNYAVNDYGNITEVTITTNASGFFALVSEPVM